MSRIPRPALAESENEPIPDSTNHKRTVDQAWSPPPPPLAPVDTNLKKKRIETKAASGDDVRPPEQQKRQRNDSQQVPLDEVALWETTKAETGWDVTDCLEHKVGNVRIGPSPSHPLTPSSSLPPSPQAVAAEEGRRAEKGRHARTARQAPARAGMVALRAA